MGYKNSPPYVQRQTDNLLRAFRHFARAYVDDVVIFSKTFEAARITSPANLQPLRQKTHSAKRPEVIHRVSVSPTIRADGRRFRSNYGLREVESDLPLTIPLHPTRPCALSRPKGMVAQLYRGICAEGGTSTKTKDRITEAITLSKGPIEEAFQSKGAIDGPVKSGEGNVSPDPGRFSAHPAS